MLLLFVSFGQLGPLDLDDDSLLCLTELAELEEVINALALGCTLEEGEGSGGTNVQDMGHRHFHHLVLRVPLAVWVQSPKRLLRDHEHKLEVSCVSYNLETWELVMATQQGCV